MERFYSNKMQTRALKNTQRFKCGFDFLNFMSIRVFSLCHVLMHMTLFIFFYGHQKLFLAHFNNFYNLILVLVHTNCFII